DMDEGKFLRKIGRIGIDHELVQIAPVREAGQRIVERLMLENPAGRAQLAVLFLRLGTRLAKLCLKDHIGAYIPVCADDPLTARRCPVERSMGADMPDLAGRQDHAKVAEERGAVTKRT